MSSEFCPICRSQMRQGIQTWHWECQKCAYEKADFAPAINDAIPHEAIDEKSRETGLRSLRLENFNKLVSVLIENGISSGHLLDVGCAHGWFLEIAGNKFSMLGLEPDTKVYQETAKLGLPVRQGFFPEALAKDELFDGIVFNDVLEHIPDTQAVLANCRAHLRTGGVLMLNLPNSSGSFYRIARLLCRLGINSYFERLWQKGLPSPHLHYFNSKNLAILLQENGFKVSTTGTLPAIRVKGLYTRVSYTGKHSLPARLLICLAVFISAPIIRLMPSDIIYIMSTKAS